MYSTSSNLCPSNQLGQIRCRLDSPVASFTNDYRRDTPCQWLLAVCSKYVRQLSLVERVDEIGRRESPRRIHSHIERAIQLKAETPISYPKLHAAYAKVEENAVDLLPPRLLDDSLKVVEIALYDPCSSPVALQANPGTTDSLRVGIHGEQRAIRRACHQDPFRMPAAPSGAIDIAFACTRR